MRKFLLTSLAGAALLVGGLRAQGVPYGEHIVSIFQNVTSSTSGLLFVDRNNSSCKPISGLSSAAQEANAVQLDPVNETVWVGTLANASLYRVSIDASCNVSSEVAYGPATTTSSTSAGIQAITFDNNGNPVAAVSGNPSGNGDGVWVYSRNNPGSASLIQAATGLNALTRDPAGNLYYGDTAGNIFMLAVQSDCSYGPPVLLGGITPKSNSPVISGLAYCPPTNELWWTSFGTNGSSIGSFSLPGGMAATSSMSTLPALNAIAFDVMRKDFTVVTAGTNPDTVFSVNKSFATSTVCTIPPSGNNGVPSGIDTCDCTGAQTNVVPNCVTGGVPFAMEFSTCCPPGDLAGIFLTQPLALPIVLCCSGASGRLVGPTFPSLVVPPGLPSGVLTFQSACYHTPTGKLTVGPPVTWPTSVN